MPFEITSEIVVAYAQCPRKAYLLLYSPEQGEPHEYVHILEQHRRENHERYLDHLQHTHADVHPYTVESLRNGSEVLLNACLRAESFAAVCDVLTRVEGPGTGGIHRYEPTLCVGTHSISPEQKLAIRFAGYVLGRLQPQPPLAGRLIAIDGTSHTIHLDTRAPDLLPLLDPLHAWATGASPEPPPILLNKHCPLCPFQRACQAQAEQEDNLSLLNGVTARLKRQYEKQGIFTVKQLSYLFKPRKRKKRSRKPPPVTHKLELQALAIRENKIYLQELPAVSRQPVELFLDIEGVPDRQGYYLIGVLVCQADTTTPYAFWADAAQDERHIWQQFVGLAGQYPDAPIYHYGSYEPRALATLAKRYHTDHERLTTRLVNVNQYIYGKVYFPVRSNRLKDIGQFIGAEWTSPQASGLQSLVWRHQWEHTQEAQYRDVLVTYNREDCQALKALTDTLFKIQHAADTLSEIDFADQPKQHATEVGKEVHSQFEAILKFAHFGYDKKKIHFRQREEKSEAKQKRGSKQGYQGQRKIRPKPTKSIHVPQGSVCPKCGHSPLQPTQRVSKRLIIDIVKRKNSLVKTIKEYVGSQGYCSVCHRSYAPSDIHKYGANTLYGHGFKAFLVYHRVDLRLPYERIADVVMEQFNEQISSKSFASFFRDFSNYYAETEQRISQRLLESPIMHADETPSNIRGTNQYVWVFTDGNYVIFKLRETREASIAHEFLAHYHGTLISDFYAGYDAVNCRQQKCWVHLIRDMNSDLWIAPFDAEFEAFVIAVRNLIIPIMEGVQRYGLKKHYLNKFKKSVDAFYQDVINQHARSELVVKYKERFVRYQDSLFTFLEQDGIPWHNNTAERAIRHLARQREISGSFHESGARDYLVLLGIRQTCRSQGKSFFKFLLSGETDLDHFASRKRQRKERDLLLTSRYLGAPLAPPRVLDHAPLGEL
jgi:predicted RecB family nuclease